MDRAQYLAKLLQFAASSPKVNDDRRAEYLSRLVHLASKLPSLDQDIAAATEDIAREARILRENARDILWRVAGATLEKRRSLNASGRDVLRILERTPDLLSPLGYARTEVAHSAALAFFLDPSRTGAVGKACLSAFIELLLRRTSDDEGDLPETLDLAGARITTERVLSGAGRVDVSIDAPNALVFVEVKVDAGEGPQQLSKYMTALGKLAVGRPSLLAFLTCDHDQVGTTGQGHRHVTFRDLLRSWLPIAADMHSPESAYLATYLKTIAEHLEGLASPGEFDGWTLRTQRAALAFIERELEL